MATEITNAQVLDMLTHREAADGFIDLNSATEIAEATDRKVRSVTAIATRAGLNYKRKARASKTGAAVESKASIVGDIAEAQGLEVEALDGLDKANKSALVALRDSLTAE